MQINKIIHHCAYTPEGAYYDSKDIWKWHVKERGWSDIGYHFTVLLDGSIEIGRAEHEIGAHCYGHNGDSIGICYIGGMGENEEKIDTRTPEQMKSLDYLSYYLSCKYYPAKFYGHNDFSSKKCPCYDAGKEYQGAEDYAEIYHGEEMAKNIWDDNIKLLIREWR